MKRFFALALGLMLFLAACTPAANNGDTPSPGVTPPVSNTSPAVSTGYTALRIGGIDISGNEYRYHYYSTVQSIVSIYGLYMGIDMETPFEEQYFDKEANVTFADFFEEQTINGLVNAVLLSEQAKNENIALSAAFTDDVETQISEMKLFCEQNNSDMATVLASYFGGNLDEPELRAIMERVNLGYQYQIQKRGSFDVSDPAIESIYAQNSGDYDEVDYLNYMFFSEVGDDGYTVIDSSKAQEGSAAFLDAVTDRDSFTKYVTDVLEEDAESVLVEGGMNEGDPVSAWLFDSARKEGDKAVIESDGVYSVLYFINRYLPDDTALSIRHVLISSENSTAAEARARAEVLYDEWKKGPATEETFAEMALNNSQDPGSVANGGLYDDVQEGQMVETFNNWCFDASRKYGDTGLVDTDYGTHIMFYSGYVPAWKNRVKLTITENSYNDFYTALLPQYEVEIINTDVSK